MMSKEEQLFSFLKLVQTDSTLQQKFQISTDPEAVAVLARNAGFELVSSDAVADLLELSSAQNTALLEEDNELVAVTGGASSNNIKSFAGLMKNTAIDVLVQSASDASTKAIEKVGQLASDASTKAIEKVGQLAKDKL